MDTLSAVDAIDHDPAPGQGPGREGFRSFFRTLTTAFPDAHPVRGLQIGRFEDGQIVERWGRTDELGIRQQIGAAPGGHESVIDKVTNAISS